MFFLVFATPSCYVWGGVGWGNNVLVRQATITLFLVHVLLNILHMWCTLQPVHHYLTYLPYLTGFTSDVHHNLFYCYLKYLPYWLDFTNDARYKLFYCHLTCLPRCPYFTDFTSDVRYNLVYYNLRYLQYWTYFTHDARYTLFYCYLTFLPYLPSFNWVHICCSTL